MILKGANIRPHVLPIWQKAKQAQRKYEIDAKSYFLAKYLQEQDKYLFTFRCGVDVAISKSHSSFFSGFVGSRKFFFDLLQYMYSLIIQSKWIFNFLNSSRGATAYGYSPNTGWSAEYSAYVWMSTRTRFYGPQISTRGSRSISINFGNAHKFSVLGRKTNITRRVHVCVVAPQHFLVAVIRRVVKHTLKRRSFHFVFTFSITVVVIIMVFVVHSRRRCTYFHSPTSPHRRQNPSMRWAFGENFRIRTTSFERICARIFHSKSPAHFSLFASFVASFMSHSFSYIYFILLSFLRLPSPLLLFSRLAE